jgi:hypothetical protein
VINDGGIVKGDRSSQDAGWVGSDKMVMPRLPSPLYIVLEGNSTVQRRKVFRSDTRRALRLWSGRHSLHCAISLYGAALGQSRCKR